ncbi:hypothetical protein M8C21_024679 [Ambrosia artemisiifolia]|uniref:Uncharacterized protein n=1 Tax=Ambrosia artemisiifolia TaxID=4212 RepID=A0AAD5CCH1_AMBAR|nr:hypothetical protein M8C21_024679 [Ambrosia artemisiifolia]
MKGSESEAREENECAGVGAPVYLEYLTSDAIIYWPQPLIISLAHLVMRGLSLVLYILHWDSKAKAFMHQCPIWINPSKLNISLEREDCGDKRLIFQKMATRLPDGNKAW